MEIQSPWHPLLIFKNDQYQLSSDVLCKKTEDSLGMHLKFRKTFCVILHGVSKVVQETGKFYICLTVWKAKSILWFKKTKNKTQVTLQVKDKPLDPDHIQDTIRSFLGIQTHPLFSTCARTNASFLCIMSIQTTTKKHE